MAVLLVASLVRLAVWRDLRDSPIPYLHRWTQSDGHFYDQWARGILGGDVLSVRTARPWHSWHDRVAREAHRDSGSTAPFSDEVGRRLWDRWLGPRTFYQDPLYAYFMAALYAILGAEAGVVRGVQGLLGVAAIGLLWAVTRGLYGDAVALVAGLMAAFLGPLVLCENVLLRTSLFTFLGTLLLWLAVRSAERPQAGMGWPLATGLAGGLAFLAHSSALPCLAVVAAVFGASARGGRRLAALGLGFLLGVALVVARNLAVGDAPLSLAASGTLTFINHNTAEYQPFGGDAVSPHLARILEASGGRALPALRATLATFPDAWGWPRLLVAKLGAFWHWYEIPNNDNYYYFLRFTPLLAALGLAFGTLAPLAVPGFVLGFRRNAAYALLLGFVASGVLTSVAFFSVSRLRTPYAFWMIPAAALVLVAFLRELRARHVGRVLAITAGVGVTAAWIGYPLPSDVPRIRAADYGVGNEIARHLATRFAAEGDLERAGALLARQLASEPEELQALEPRGASSVVPLWAGELAGSFAPLHGLAADIAERSGRSVAAAQQRRRQLVLGAVAAQHQAVMLQP